MVWPHCCTSGLDSDFFRLVCDRVLLKSCVFGGFGEFGEGQLIVCCAFCVGVTQRGALRRAASCGSRLVDLGRAGQGTIK